MKAPTMFMSLAGTQAPPSRRNSWCSSSRTRVLRCSCPESELATRPRRGFGEQGVLGERAVGGRAGPTVSVDDRQELVEDSGEVCLVASVERRRYGQLERFRTGRHDLDAGEVGLPRHDRLAQRARDVTVIGARLDEDPAMVVRAGALLQTDVRASPVSDAVRDVSATRRRREVPPRRSARRHLTDLIDELGVASITQRVAVNERLELPWEPRLSGDPPECLGGHTR